MKGLLFGAALFFWGNEKGHAVRRALFYVGCGVQASCQVVTYSRGFLWLMGQSPSG